VTTARNSHKEKYFVSLGNIPHTIVTFNPMTMNEARPLSIPVILGTTRKGRMSTHAARFVFGQLQKREGITSELIDIGELNLPIDDAGEAVKDPRFSAAMERADAIVIVSPEYNHSFPGLLTHVLDIA
jgi:NAD(P)H-dependent FMN reductase